MARYVPDIKTQRWVIIAETRKNRPDDIKIEAPRSHLGSSCPFCPGNEHATPPEVYRIGLGGKEEPGWQVRVVPNKFPITDIHEVFIHSIDHNLEISQLPTEQISRIFTAYRDRYVAHASDGHVIIFCNQGKTAGASLAHPHSQLVVVPKQINFDSLSREPVQNIIEEEGGLVSYCPDFSQWPYEVWIAPIAESKTFGDNSNAELSAISTVVQRTIQRIRSVHATRQASKPDASKDPFTYNYYISHGEHWFIRIIPRFIHRAGFELGTGLSVNIIDPSQAAKELQNAI